jgi:hypothetical protein
MALIQPQNYTKNYKHNYATISIIIIIVVIVIWFIIYYSYSEDFVSLGTIVDLQSKDSQNLYLNGNEIYPYVDNNYLYGFNMSTRGTNRGSNMLNNVKKDIPVSIEEDAYCFGTDFYDNGKCGEVFIADDFGKNKTNKLTVYKDQYTGTYVDFPNVDVMKPLNIYNDMLFKK